MDNKGITYWITGLSGAGKTTVGTLLYNHIRRMKPNVFNLDGDIGRKAYNDKLGYTKQERLEGAYRNARVCKMITDQGIDVVCCTMSMFDAVREWNRENIERYTEIFLNVPMDVLMKRDKKGIYSAAIQGRMKYVGGVDLELEYPKSPDITIVNDGTHSPEEVLAIILSDLQNSEQRFGEIS